MSTFVDADGVQHEELDASTDLPPNGANGRKPDSTQETKTSPKGAASPKTKRAPRRVSLDAYTLKDIPDIPTATVIECLNDEEYGDGALFAEVFTGRCIYDHSNKEWYTWQGHYWKVDTIRLMRHLVSGILASVYIKAAAEVNLWAARLEHGGNDDDAAAAKKYRALEKALYARARSMKMVSRMKNILEFASSFLYMTADMWDTNKWLLGTLNGVIDLRTGSLRPGEPRDYIRTVIPAKWEGINATCPRFVRFLLEIFAYKAASNGDIVPTPEQELNELISFIHRVLGYAITGLVTEHVFLMLFGDEGRNGKDTLMTALKKVLGDTVGAVPTDVLIGTSKFTAPGSAKPHLVALQGKRIAWANETDKGQRFDIGQVKDITGGGDIPARQLYGKDYAFEPSHLLTLLTNNKPHADAKDKAFWERICPIVFNVRFVDNPDPTKPFEHKPDKTLGAALEAEASGILAWLVRGCLKWQMEGLNVPASVLRDRAKYKEEEDTLGLFLSEYCVASPQCQVKPQLLYSKYTEWCEQNALKPMSGTVFGTEVSKAYRKVHTEGGNHYEGLGLREAYPDLSEEENREHQEQDGQQGSHEDDSPVPDAPPSQQTEQEQVQRWFTDFTSRPGYALRFNTATEKFIVSVPQEVTDAEYEAYVTYARGKWPLLSPLVARVSQPEGRGLDMKGENK